MKAAIAVKGCFHAFEMARELHARDSLAQLITTYPRATATARGVPRASVTALPWIELRDRLARRGPKWLRDCCQGDLEARFAQATSDHLRDRADVFVGFAGQSGIALRRASELGMRTVLERSSAHILEQDRLLEAAARRFGIPAPRPSAEHIARELAEYDQVDAISVPSSFARQTFLERGFDPSRVLLTPLGVDVERFRPCPRGAPRDLLRVVYCGNVSVQKGCPLLFELNHPALRQAELCLVGGVAPELEALVRSEKGSWGRVTALGHVPQRRLPRLFSDSALLVHPALHDGFGLVILQAMACGLPVLTSDRCGGPDVLRDGIDGRLVRAGDSAGLAEALAALLEDPDLRDRMGRSAQERVRRNWTWKHYGARWQKTLVGVAAQELEVAK